MKPKFALFSVAALAFLCFSAASHASDVSLQWDPNTEPDIGGYKIYYKADNADLPFTGVGAQNGDSPVDTGKVTTFSINGLEDDHIYYFAVTAYDTSGYESLFSNIVSSEWRPKLLFPIQDEPATPLDFHFQWRAFAAPAGTTYTLYYGTDPNFASAPEALASAYLRKLSRNGGNGNTPLGLFVFAVALLFAIAQRVRQQQLASVAALGTLIVASGCGPSLLNKEVSNPTDTGVYFTETIPNVNETNVLITNLIPNTQYYWKVVAHSNGKTFTSKKGSFRTSDY